MSNCNSWLCFINRLYCNINLWYLGDPDSDLTQPAFGHIY